MKAIIKLVLEYNIEDSWFDEDISPEEILEIEKNNIEDDPGAYSNNISSGELSIKLNNGTELKTSLFKEN